MEMIRHQAVREASPAESSHGAIQPHQERVAVAVIAKDVLPAVAPRRDVVSPAEHLLPRGSPHVETVRARRPRVDVATQVLFKRVWLSPRCPTRGSNTVPASRLGALGHRNVDGSTRQRAA